MPFPHGKRHHRTSLQQQIAGRDTADALPKECCTWQALIPKHSHGPATSYTYSSQGQMFQGSFQINSVRDRITKIHFLGCFSHATMCQLSGLFMPSLGWLEISESDVPHSALEREGLMGLTHTTPPTSCSLAGSLNSWYSWICLWRKAGGTPRVSLECWGYICVIYPVTHVKLV